MTTLQDMLDMVMEKAYDSFTFELDRFQLLYADKGQFLYLVDS